MAKQFEILPVDWKAEYFLHSLYKRFDNDETVNLFILPSSSNKEKIPSCLFSNKSVKM